MTINLNLPQELEQELSIEATKINLSLPDYILSILSTRQLLNNPPKTGANLVDYWQKEGLINSRSDIQDSQEYARKIRHEAEHRQQL